MNFYDLAHRLAKNIKKSEEYEAYTKLREKIVSDTKAKEMYLDFQKEQMKLQSKHMSGQEITEEDQKRLTNLRDIINLNADIKKYLDAEFRMSTLLNDVQRIIFADLEVGIYPDPPQAETKETKEETEKVEDKEKTE